MKKEKKDINNILNDLYFHLNEILELCFDYKWSTEEQENWVPTKYLTEKYGYGKDLSEFINDIEQALINLQKYKDN